MNNIKSGQYWNLKGSPDYLMLVKYVVLGIVFVEHNGISATIKKKRFLEHFEYSHYAPTHQEMG